MQETGESVKGRGEFDRSKHVRVAPSSVENFRKLCVNVFDFVLAVLFQVTSCLEWHLHERYTIHVTSMGCWLLEVVREECVREISCWGNCTILIV